MPLFEYRCQDCDEKFEELVPYSRSEEMDCPKCGSGNTRKLVSAFATTGSSSGGGSSYGSSCGGGGGRFT
jgi:putative FmdB family regulatory protein